MCLHVRSKSFFQDVEEGCEETFLRALPGLPSPGILFAFKWTKWSEDTHEVLSVDNKIEQKVCTSNCKGSTYYMCEVSSKGTDLDSSESQTLFVMYYFLCKLTFDLDSGDGVRISFSLYRCSH